MADPKKDEVVDHFDTYEEYLDTFVETEDLRYLGESEIARIIVELGYRLVGDFITSLMIVVIQIQFEI